jgi:hypothetical protein
MNRKEKLVLIIIWFSILLVSFINYRAYTFFYLSGSLLSTLLTPTLIRFIDRYEHDSKVKKIVSLKKELEKLEHETS